MKFEELLMLQPPPLPRPNYNQDSNNKQKMIKNLEEEVKELEQELQGEIQLKSALQCALQGPSVHSCPCVSSLLLPTKIQKLLTQVALLEEEVLCLERKVYGLKLNLHQEQKMTKQKEMMHQLIQVQKPQLETKKKKQSIFKQKNETEFGQQHRKHRFFRGRRSSASSASSAEFCSLSFNGTYEETAKVPRQSTSNGKDVDFEIEINGGKSNRLSEELLTCLISIYLKLNQKSSESKAESSSSIAPKRTSSTLKSKKMTSKTSFKCTTLPILSLDKNSLCVDENSMDLDGAFRDIGPYKDYIQITQSSIHKRRLPQCFSALKKLRDLLDELSNVDPTYLTYKQKLAFWINIFNASTMHAFLRLGFPSAQDKLLEVMNETAINVGGIVLNALAIEHFILGHPSESQWGMPEEKEMLVRRSYGLEYPEPNVTFALCRGSWSSPALRVYKPEEVVNQLEKAKIEYLEASIVITSKKKIMLPKLMQWHMRDFADDMELLIEWIYSQLPPSSSLKGLIMECLSFEKKCPTTKMIEILPYNFEFRYIFFLQNETKQV